MSAASRRRRQHANGFTHLARICGKAFTGGRPIYRRSAPMLSVQDAIMRERRQAAAEQARKAKKRTK